MDHCSPTRQEGAPEKRKNNQPSEIRQLAGKRIVKRRLQQKIISHQDSQGSQEQGRQQPICRSQAWHRTRLETA
jgi:hypothetical protein